MPVPAPVVMRAMKAPVRGVMMGREKSRQPEQPKKGRCEVTMVTNAGGEAMKGTTEPSSKPLDWQRKGVAVGLAVLVWDEELEAVPVEELEAVPVLLCDEDGEPVLELLAVPVEELEAVPVEELEPVLVCDEDGEPVLELLGVPVLELLAVPVEELEGVPVRELEPVLVCDEDGEPVLELLGVPVLELLEVPV